MGERLVGRLTRPTIAWLAVAGAPCSLAILLAMGLVLAAAGRDPVWTPPALTLSEAAALRDAAEIVRLIGEGTDPNRRYPVRAGILSRRTRDLTPLEAARASRRAEIVELLLELGARP